MSERSDEKRTAVMQVFLLLRHSERACRSNKTAAAAAAAERWQWSIACWVLTASAFGCSPKKKVDRLAAALRVTD